MTDNESLGHRVCMRDHLREEILKRILDGRYPPEMHLKEMALAKEFGTSQAPVREALRELEAIGLLSSERYKGTKVRSICSVELRDSYELRAIIEERALLLALPYGEDDLQILSDQVEQMKQAGLNHDRESYSRAALIFHRQIVLMSGNQPFIRAFDAMQWGVLSRIAIYQKAKDLTAHAYRHEEILNALKQQDGIAAGAKLKKMLDDFIIALGQLCQQQ